MATIPSLRDRAEQYAEAAKNNALMSGATKDKANEIYEDAFSSVYKDKAAANHGLTIDDLDPEGLSKKDHEQTQTVVEIHDNKTNEEISSLLNNPSKANAYASAINNDMTDEQKLKIAQEVNDYYEAKMAADNNAYARMAASAATASASDAVGIHDMGENTNGSNFNADSLERSLEIESFGELKNELVYSPDGSTWEAKNDDSLAYILKKYEEDIQDYLYDLEPQSQNLFWCGFFTENSKSKTFYNAPFRIRKVTFPSLELELDQHPETKTPLFKGAKYDQTIGIDWFEDIYHSVNQYHEDWQARWYNRYYDVLRCGASGKFRKCTLVAYHKINTNSNGIIEKPKIEPLIAYEIGGMVPMQKTELSYDQDNDQNDTLYHVNYRCGKITVRYSDNIAYGFKEDLYTSNKTDKVQNKSVWKPTGYVEADLNTGTGYEALRIVRSASTHYF